MRLMYREYMRKISFARHPDEKQEDHNTEGNGDMVKQRMGGATTGTIRTDQERIIQEDVHRVGR
jgi:hypothetical protein